LITSPQGLYCPEGDFHIDPHGPVDRAIISHGHSDHARKVAKKYLTHKDSAAILRTRLGRNISISTLDYGEPLTINGVKVTLYPAGHLLGSSQVCCEYQGRITVFTGDFGTTKNITCEPFQPVKCDTFIPESTFGLPIYEWDDPEMVYNEINEWWKSNRDSGLASVLFCYSLGKAQRLLAALDSSIAPIIVHNSVHQMNKCYLDAGINLPEALLDWDKPGKPADEGAIILAPQSALSGEWRTFPGSYSTGFASGWMLIKKMRKFGDIDRGFVLSDHADWSGLLNAVKETGAERVYPTHGFTKEFSKYLSEIGYDSSPLETTFTGDEMNGES
jgi:putative mRNA 3-end processing factor